MDAAALLERKKRSRAGHHSSATRPIERAMTALADAIDEDQLTLLKQMLVEKLEVLKNLDGEITDLVPEEELEKEIIHTDEYTEKMYGTIAKLMKALALVKAILTPARDPASVSTDPAHAPIDPAHASTDPAHATTDPAHATTDSARGPPDPAHATTDPA